MANADLFAFSLDPKIVIGDLSIATKAKKHDALTLALGLLCSGQFSLLAFKSVQELRGVP
jgi:hypothetical protein